MEIQVEGGEVREATDPAVNLKNSGIKPSVHEDEVLWVGKGGGVGEGGVSASEMRHIFRHCAAVPFSPQTRR